MTLQLNIPGECQLDSFTSNPISLFGEASEYFIRHLKSKHPEMQILV